VYLGRDCEAGITGTNSYNGTVNNGIMTEKLWAFFLNSCLMKHVVLHAQFIWTGHFCDHSLLALTTSSIVTEIIPLHQASMPCRQTRDDEEYPINPVIRPPLRHLPGHPDYHRP